MNNYTIIMNWVIVDDFDTNCSILSWFSSNLFIIKMYKFGLLEFNNLFLKI